MIVLTDMREGNVCDAFMDISTNKSFAIKFNAQYLLRDIEGATVTSEHEDPRISHLYAIDKEPCTHWVHHIEVTYIWLVLNYDKSFVSIHSFDNVFANVCYLLEHVNRLLLIARLGDHIITVQKLLGFMVIGLEYTFFLSEIAVRSWNQPSFQYNIRELRRARLLQ
jgi:hypothetical protein